MAYREQKRPLGRLRTMNTAVISSVKRCRALFRLNCSSGIGIADDRRTIFHPFRTPRRCTALALIIDRFSHTSASPSLIFFFHVRATMTGNSEVIGKKLSNVYATLSALSVRRFSNFEYDTKATRKVIPEWITTVWQFT